MIIQVNVKPSSGKEEIVKISEGEYVVYLRVPAREGKANIELLKVLSKFFKVNFKSIKIKNPRSRKKIVEICR
ncbi:MAG: DUF167 domain-containing protein [Candidatus Pacearchaeota archaeon]|nr:DUF167 domain-containing protein [Candidatus Pacearchaeota archaeon]